MCLTKTNNDRDKIVWKDLDIHKTIGGGYNRFWNFRGRYRAVKGGRASKKSTTTALWLIYHIMRMPQANVLVVRKYFVDHKDSTFAQLKWAARRLNVYNLWQFKLSPLEAIYKPTGQKILFRGLDDPTSTTSITVDQGFLCWVWFEEAYQIKSERDVDIIDGTIRGDLPDGYFKQLTFTFNPWSDKHWLKRRFFDAPDANTLALTTTYRNNEFLGRDDEEYYSNLSPRRRRIEADGEWGISEGLIYENWKVQEFDIENIKKEPGALSAFGLDFGYTVDPSAFVASIILPDKRQLYIHDEFYKQGMSNGAIAEMIKYKGYAKERIIADSAEPKSIDEIKRLGIARIDGAVKGRDSVMHGIQAIQDYQIIVHPACKNTEIELSNYCFKKTREGEYLNEPDGEFNHLMDALRYATIDRITMKPRPRFRRL